MQVPGGEQVRDSVAADLLLIVALDRHHGLVLWFDDDFEQACFRAALELHLNHELTHVRVGGPIGTGAARIQFFEKGAVTL